MIDPSTISPLLDGIVIGGKLGKGSVGTCYAATRRADGRKLVVKHISIPSNEARTQALIYSGAVKDVAGAQKYYYAQAADIKNELVMINNLETHTNLLRFRNSQIDAKITGTGYDMYLLCAYFPNLPTVLREKPLSKLQTVNLAIDLASALEQLRAGNLLHHNIHPRNIFAADGQFLLGDIGVAKLDELEYSVQPDSQLTVYTAPEVLVGENTLSETMDIYSVGIVLYELCNGGTLPVNEAGQFIRSGANDLPAPKFADEGFAEIILRACAFHQADRYQSPTDMKQALMLYLQSSDVRDEPLVPEAEAPAEVPAEVPASEPVGELAPAEETAAGEEAPDAVPAEPAAEDVIQQQNLPEESYMDTETNQNNTTEASPVGDETIVFKPTSGLDIPSIGMVADELPRPTLNDLKSDDLLAGSTEEWSIEAFVHSMGGAQFLDTDGNAIDMSQFLPPVEPAASEMPVTESVPAAAPAMEAAPVEIVPSADAPVSPDTEAAPAAQSEDDRFAFLKDLDSEMPDYQPELVTAELEAQTLSGEFNAENIPPYNAPAAEAPAEAPAPAPAPAPVAPEVPAASAPAPVPAAPAEPAPQPAHVKVERPSIPIATPRYTPAYTNEELYDDDDEDEDDEYEVDEDDEDDETSSGGAWKTILAIAIVLLILAAGAAALYILKTDTVSSMNSQVLSSSSIAVTADTRLDTSTNVVCTTLSGTEIASQPYTDGGVIFTDLTPSTSYNFTLESNEGKFLLGTHSISAKTNQQTNITSFAASSVSAVTATLKFGGNGPLPDTWVIDVTPSEGGESQQVETSDTTVTLDGLSPATSYDAVISRSDGDTLAGSTTCSFTTMDYTYLAAFDVSDVTIDSATVTWGYTGTVPDAWEVTCENSDGESTTQEVSGDASECTFEGLESGGTYTISISCVSLKESELSTVTVGIPSVTMTSVTAELNEDGEIDVNWEYTSNNVTPESWEITYCYQMAGDTRSEPEVITTDDTNAVITDLLPDCTYIITVTKADDLSVGGTAEATCKSGTVADFTDYGCSNAELTLYVKDDSGELDTPTTSFTTTDLIAFALQIDYEATEEDKSVDTTYIIRDYEGNPVIVYNSDRSWSGTWTTARHTGDLPNPVDVPGGYTFEVYFNGQFVASASFTVA